MQTILAILVLLTLGVATPVVAYDQLRAMLPMSSLHWPEVPVWLGMICGLLFMIGECAAIWLAVLVVADAWTGFQFRITG